MASRAFLLLLLLAFALPRAARAAVTYVKPHYAYVSEWSPASDRASAASAHSAAMNVYSTALENNPRMKPSRY